jgi:hypothetical protein
MASTRADRAGEFAPGGAHELREIVTTLCGWERESAGPGERRAAEWIAARLRAIGVPEVRLEREPAHGGYWWPLGLLSLVAGLAALQSRRLPRMLLGAVAALGISDELELRRGVWTRRLLRRRTTTNVVAELGPRDAPRCVVVIAHHDAAHSGAIFNPALIEAMGRRFPGMIGGVRMWPRIMRLVLAGPLLVALGARRLGAAVSLTSAAAFADIARSAVVPGANDNLSGVAAMIAVAHGLSASPLSSLRVVLLSAGAEESFEEGSQAFFRRHAQELAAARTQVIVLDTVGSPTLVLVEGEGMLRRTEYDRELKDALAAAAGAAGVPIERDYWLSFGSDALAAIRAGFPGTLLGSVNRFNLPANYHWPSDTPENVDFDTVAAAAQVVEGALRRLAASDR